MNAGPTSLQKNWLKILTVALLGIAELAIARDQPSKPDNNGSPPTAEVLISDVALFYRVYDAANGSPSAEALQRDYLDAGSDGLRQFIPQRIGSAEKLAKTIGTDREQYERARGCAAKLPDVRERVSAALAKLGKLYPDAKFPPVTLLIGRGNSGGTSGKAGVLIGVETICKANWLHADIGDRLLHLIAHEYIHVQQPVTEQIENPVDGKRTVLDNSLVEGVAEFVGEMISGSITNVHLQRFAVGREGQIETAFLADMHKSDRADMSRWLYNGLGTADWPGDLGYWVGYRIAQQFYERSPDKTAALRELILLPDAEAILDRSDWVDRTRAGRQALTVPAGGGVTASMQLSLPERG